MSSAKTEKTRSKPVLLKADPDDEECVGEAGKPCIDFQPDDRWHIKEENDDQEELNNSKRRRSSRKRKNSMQRTPKAKRSALAVNGELTKEGSDQNDVDCKPLSQEMTDNISDTECDGLDSSVNLEAGTQKVSIKADVKNIDISSVVKSETKDLSGAVKKERSCDSSISVKSESHSLTETNGIGDTKLNCTNFMKKEPKPEIVTEKEPEIVTKKEPKPEIVGIGEKELDSSSDSSTFTENKDLAPVLKDERTKNSGSGNSKEDLSGTEEGVGKDRSMPELSSNENSQSSLKKDDVDIAIIEEKLSTVNSEAGESDGEVQIISTSEKGTPKDSSFAEEKLYEQSFCKDKSLSREELLLSPGFPYFNSLQEKIKSFVAGKYKPVKFPHMGTLMLEENEVIIESPSLLVPLLIKEADEFPKLDEDATAGEGSTTTKPKTVRRNFFQSSVGQFLINLGGSRVMEWYHKDMRRNKQRQLKKSPSDQAIKDSLEECHKSLVVTKNANAPFNHRFRKCEFCDFKTESRLVLEGHYLIPHVTSRREFRCNFCSFLCRDPKEMAFHFEAIHDKRVVSEDQTTVHECRFCSFHSHLRSKVNAHMNRCRKYFLPSQNQSPPFDFEFPGVTTKPVTIADVIAHRRMLMGSTKASYTNSGQSANVDSAIARKKLASVLNLTGSEAFPDSPTLIKHLMGPHSKQGASGFQLPPGIVLTRPRVRAQQVRQAPQSMQPRLPGMRANGPRNPSPYPSSITSTASHLASSGISITPINKQEASSARMSVGSQGNMKNITLTPISSAGNLVSQKPGPPQPIALFTNVAGSEISKARAGMVPMSQPSRMALVPGGRPARMMAPYQRLNTPPSQVIKNSSGGSFVLCEICDSYIKDLEELRSHMNWVHKVKIHPKMLVSRPPLNCQKCQWRFFTDQGLERHLLGAHGLVTTNMQEMANKNQDGGRCIICGAVFTYKLVSHMTQVHKVTLKPAHLSYKCTVCTATFTLYRLFESHVYNVHSASAKRPAEDSSSASASSEAPPPKKAAPSTSVERPKPEPISSSKKCSECGLVTDNMEKHIIEKHLKECRVKLCRIEKCEKCLYSSDEMLVIRMSDFDGYSGSDDDSSDEEEEDEEDDDAAPECSKKVEVEEVKKPLDSDDSKASSSKHSQEGENA